MADYAKQIAVAVRRVFRLMKLQYRGGRERFLSLTPDLADAIFGPLSSAVLGGLRLGQRPAGGSAAGRLTADQRTELGNGGAAAAKERSLATARSILQTTNNWLAEGRDEEQVFGADRIAMIALTEAKWATGMGMTLAVQARKGKLRWVTKGNPPCKECKLLAGRVRKAGVMFTSVNGVAVYHPPHHPGCLCVLESV